MQVAALRANFDEAQSRVGAVSSNLRGQWHQSMALQVWNRVSMAALLQPECLTALAALL